MSVTLPLGLTEEALAAAGGEPEPESLAASVRLRQRFGPDLAAAAVTQVTLRRRGTAKFGPAAAGMFFTRVGLEQATRPDVAAHRAARLAETGVRRVLDLGCGLGSDALAFARAGLEVVAVDRDPDTAAVARANLGGHAEVLVGDAAELLDRLDRPGTAVFADPARRTARGRSWRVADLSPPWPFVVALLDRPAPTVVKLGPGLPHHLVPDQAEAEWVDHRGDTVEVALWSGTGAVAGRRSALVLPEHRLVADPAAGPVPVGPPAGWLYDPVGAVTRAGALPVLARQLDAVALHPEVVYLTADRPVSTPYATAFAITEMLPFSPAGLRAWARAAGIGALEILTRGLDLDPARLRSDLRLAGPQRASVVITRAGRQKLVLVVRRQ